MCVLGVRNASRAAELGSAAGGEAQRCGQHQRVKFNYWREKWSRKSGFLTPEILIMQVAKGRLGRK